jgi:hypothetical protein
VGVMETPSRRALFALSAAGLCVLRNSGAVAASLHTIGLPAVARLDLANALNFRSFRDNKDTLGLTAVMAMRPVEGKLDRYPTGSLFLFPFKRAAFTPDKPAFLPGSSAERPIIATAPMTTLGLAPDEYFCHYVLKAPWQSFISCALDTPIAREIGPWPWHSNVAIGDETVGFRWTSSNLNNPWFSGSRWIPESDHGKAWRTRIIDGVRRAAAITC